MPLAWASAATSPNDSLRDGIATTSAAWYQRARVSRSAGGCTTTSSATPVIDASASSSRTAVVRPDGPPSTTSSGTGRPVALSTPSALTSTSGALSACTRPAKSTIWRSCGRPSSAARGRSAVARHEPVEVDAGLDHVHPGRVGAVELDQLLGLDRACWPRARARRRPPAPRRSRARSARRRRRAPATRSSRARACARCAPAGPPSGPPRSRPPARTASSASARRRTSRAGARPPSAGRPRPSRTARRAGRSCPAARTGRRGRGAPGSAATTPALDLVGEQDLALLRCGQRPRPPRPAPGSVTVSAWSDDVARVKISTRAPRAASARDSSST